jgi:hypothetical protein
MSGKKVRVKVSVRCTRVYEDVSVRERACPPSDRTEMTLPPEDSRASANPYVDDQVIVAADDLSVTHYRPGDALSGDAGDGNPGIKGKAADTRDEAVSQAGDVKDSAVQAGTHVAAVAKDQAGAVVAEAGNHVQNLLSQTRGELSSQAGTQQQRLAGGLHSLGDELHSMASGNDQPGLASELTRQAAQRTKSVANWLESREPADVLHDVATFARQRPGLFIAISAGAGLLVGRLARGLKDDASSDSVDTAPAYVAPTGYDIPASRNGDVAVSGYGDPVYNGGVR